MIQKIYQNHKIEVLTYLAAAAVFASVVLPIALNNSGSENDRRAESKLNLVPGDGK